MKPKIRITLLDNNLAPLSDRLVDQGIEFMQGPKDKHEGPVKIEFILETKNDAIALKKYIDQLSEGKPEKEVSSRGRPTNTKELSSPREDILLEVENMAKEGKTQEDIIKHLRSLGFLFLLTEDLLRYFPDFPFQIRDIGQEKHGQYPDSYHWLLRCTKFAKDPRADKFDPMLLFGFKFGKSKRIIPYLFRNRSNKIKADQDSNNPVAFNQIQELTKFPHYQTEEERLKWQTEMRQLISNHDKKPSKFFLRWASEVILSKDNAKNLSHLGNIFKK